MEVKEKVRVFLSKFFGNYILEDNEDIFSVGFVNSMFAMELVLFIEKEFNISIDNEDLEINNFNTITNIEKFLAFKKSVENTAL